MDQTKAILLICVGAFSVMSIFAPLATIPLVTTLLIFAMQLYFEKSESNKLQEIETKLKALEDKFSMQIAFGGRK